MLALYQTKNFDQTNVGCDTDYVESHFPFCTVSVSESLNIKLTLRNVLMFFSQNLYSFFVKSVINKMWQIFFEKKG